MPLFKDDFFLCPRAPVSSHPTAVVPICPADANVGTSGTGSTVGAVTAAGGLSQCCSRQREGISFHSPRSPQGFAPHHTDAPPSSSTSQLRGPCVSARGEQQAQELGITRTSHTGIPLPAAAFCWVFARLCPWPQWPFAGSPVECPLALGSTSADRNSPRAGCDLPSPPQIPPCWPTSALKPLPHPKSTPAQCRRHWHIILAWVTPVQKQHWSLVAAPGLQQGRTQLNVSQGMTRTGSKADYGMGCPLSHRGAGVSLMDSGPATHWKCKNLAPKKGYKVIKLELTMNMVQRLQTTAGTSPEVVLTSL